jgi:AraC family L-rhamnose operon transcriptional activator RhaR
MDHLHADPASAHELYLQWHTKNFFPPDAIVAVWPFRHHPTTPWHDHDFYELALIESGRGLHESDEGVRPLRPGVGLLLPPGAGHEYRGCENMRVYNCLFRAELLDAELMWARRDRLLGPLFDSGRSTEPAPDGPQTYVELDPGTARRFIDALEPVRTGEAATRAAQLARLLLALDIVSTAASAQRTDDSPMASAVVTEAVDLMAGDLAFPWTLDELSRRVYVGRFHLAHLFARTMGQPPMQYLARLRGERAAALLTGTDLPVAAIGAKVGWPDPAYFSRRFRAAFGVAPRDYRRGRSEPDGTALRPVKEVQEQGKGGQVGA